jgi:hypothetical protein
VAVTFQRTPTFAVASRRIVGIIPRDARGWDIDATGKRLVYGVDQGGLEIRRLIVTMNALTSAHR